MLTDIDTVFEYLSWNNSKQIQKLGMKMASKIKHLSVLIMPIENKSVWENCAKVLAQKSDDELLLYLSMLFEWLKDMNWPGAYIIYDRLLCVSIEHFITSYKYSILKAKKANDHVWEMALNDLYNEYVSKNTGGNTENGSMCSSETTE